MSDLPHPFDSHPGIGVRMNNVPITSIKTITAR